jgi:7-keto-8-aminopelargonate synthetase-like enzyme
MPLTLESPIGAEIVVDGRRYINFGGSSYLGLSVNAQILEAGIAALRECGAGYQFPRHYQIASRAHQEVESQAAVFFGSPTAVYLGGGYYFGLIAIAAMRELLSAIFFDELSHHSLREAIAASGLASYPFRHLDAEDLGRQLQRHLRAGGRPLVVTDGMYSTFGEIAPLDELMPIAASYDGYLLVDESHSFGVLGNLGRGAHEHHGIPAASALIGGSLSKAFGACGGIIPARAEHAARFRAAPAARGSAAGLPAAAAMCAASLKHVGAHPELLQRLRANVRHLKGGLCGIGLNVGDSVAPVATFSMPSYESAQRLQSRLMSEGLLVFHSTYIGADDSGVIRCGIFADHTPEHIDHLVATLRRIL